MSSPLHLFPGAALPDWVAALERTVFGDPWGPLEAHEHLLALPELTYARWSVIPAAGEAELLRIAVSPEARRQGLARGLLEDSEVFLRGAGIKELYLEVRFSNTAARGLYEALGWSEQRVRKGYYRDGEDAVIYGKTLIG